MDRGDQGIATPTVITPYHAGDPVGPRARTQGSVDITPEVPIPRSNLTTAFEQDRALPAQKAVALR